MNGPVMSAFRAGAPGRVPTAIRNRSAGSTETGPGVRDQLSLQVVNDLGDWADAWDELVDAAPVPSPFLRSWWVSQVAGSPPQFVLVTDRDGLLGGMALQRDSVAGIPRYRVLGHGRLVPDHLDVLLHPRATTRVTEELRRWCCRPGRRIFDLDGVVPDSRFLDILPAPVISHRVGTSPYRQLIGRHPDQILRELPGAQRNTIARARGKLTAAGVQHRVLPMGEIACGLQRLRDLHGQRWGDESGFLDVFGRFAAAAHHGAARGEVIVHELYRGEDVLASQVDLVVGGRVSSFQAGRDMTSDLPSLGSVLMAEAVEHACRTGARDYDFLRGDQHYKAAWADAERPVLRLQSTTGRTAEIARVVVASAHGLGHAKGRLRRALVRSAREFRDTRVGAEPGNTTASSTPAASVITVPEELESLRPGWAQLRADVPGPSSELDHVIANGRNLPPGESLRVVVLRDDRRVVAVAPLKLTEVRGRRRLRPLEPFEATGLLFADTEALRALVPAVVGLGLPLELDRLPTDAPTATELRRLDRRRLVLQAGNRTAGPSLPLDDTWREPAAHLSKGRRRDLRRTRRNAESRGGFKVEVIHPGGDLEQHFSDLVGLEADGWKGRCGTSLADHPLQQRALFDYLTAPRVRDRVRVARMLIADDVVAVDLNVIVGTRLWGLKGAYDEAYRDTAPGLQLKAAAIQFAAEQGLERFEFMGDTASFKEMWGQGPVRLCAARVYPPSVCGVAALVADAGEKLLRRRATFPEVRGDADAARRAFRRVGETVPVSGSATVQVIADRRELERRRWQWDALDTDEPGAPSGSLDWVLAYAGQLPAGERLRVVTVQREGRLTGAAPLVLTGGRWRGRLRLVILSTTGLRYANDTELHRLIEAIAGIRRPIALDLLPEDGPTARAARDGFGRRWLRRSSRGLGGPSLELDESWTDPLSKLKKGERKNLQRVTRRAAETGELRYECHPCADVEDLRRWFDAYVRVEALGWKADTGITFAADAVRRRMYWDYLSSPHVLARVRFCVLRIGDDIAAIEIDSLSATRWWGEKASFDPAYARVSPGTQLLVHTIRDAVDRGLERFEFSGGLEPYKTVWGHGMPLVSIKAYPANIPGGLAILTDGLVSVTRRLTTLTDRRLRRAGGTAHTGRERAPSGAAPTTRSTIAYIDEPADLEALRAHWSALRPDVPAPGSQLAWILAHARTMPPTAELRIVTVADAGRVTGIAPLTLTTGRSPRLKLISDDGSGFLATDLTQRSRLVADVLALGIPLDLDALVTGSPTHRLLSEQARITRHTTRLAGPSLPLDESWTDALAQLKHGRRRNLRRSLERAETMGDVVFDAFAPGGALETWFDDFVRIEDSGWKGRQRSSLATDHRLAGLLRDYLCAPDVRSEVRMFSLHIGGVLVALDIAVIVGGHLWWLKGGYDEDYATCGPGQLLKWRTIEWAATQGLTHYEFMGMTEPYKEMWGAAPVHQERIRTYPLRTAGLEAVITDSLGKATRLAQRRTHRLRQPVEP